MAPGKKPEVAKATAKAPAKVSVRKHNEIAPPPPTANGARASGPAGRTAAKATLRSGAGPYATDAKFLQEQRRLLEHERSVYQGQAADLKAEADSLAQEREPGDVQFDEESGEGGTVAVDRERDLALSAQALAAVEEIDASIERIDDATYGACEKCHQPIPKPRLKALPYARLCVACKSGGLTRR
jgi:DnaK suppressor protein